MTGALRLIREGPWAVSLPPSPAMDCDPGAMQPLAQDPTALRSLRPSWELPEAVASFVSPLGQGDTEVTKTGEVPALEALHGIVGRVKKQMRLLQWAESCGGTCGGGRAQGGEHSVLNVSPLGPLEQKHQRLGGL